MESEDKKTVLVIGAKRGVGLQLLKTFQRRGWKVYGSVRPASRHDPSMQDLRDTGATIFHIDYTDERSIREATKELGETPLDCLVNCGGFGVKPDGSWSYSSDMILEPFKVITLGPFLATKHFRPALEKGRAGKVLNISSEMGSLANNDREGENVGYRMAKAALNQQTKTLARELAGIGSGISLVAVCPGFVATRLTDFRGEDDIEASCNGMVDIVLKLTPETSGQFLNWKGEHIPW